MFKTESPKSLLRLLTLRYLSDLSKLILLKTTRTVKYRRIFQRLELGRVGVRTPGHRYIIPRKILFHRTISVDTRGNFFLLVHFDDKSVLLRLHVSLVSVGSAILYGERNDDLEVTDLVTDRDRPKVVY